MTKEKFLTVRWNNLLSLGLGSIALIYVVVVLSTSVWSTRAGFIGLSVIGVIFWIAVEFHTLTRFAWLRDHSDNYVSVKLRSTNRLIFAIYNLVWFAPIVLAFLGTIDYGTGFITFVVITVVRAGLNLYTNNVANFTPEQFESFPFRIPWTVER